MRFGKLDHFITGVSVPVSALRTRDSCGVGEFADLLRLGLWCRRVGLEVIQVLPVNDTGGNSSPYSALSAFALHPLYLGLQYVQGMERYSSRIDDFRRTAETRARLSYGETLDFKLSMVERVFSDNLKTIRSDPGFARWLAENPWVAPYAAFTALKKETSDAPWSSWGGMADPSPGDITSYWESRKDQCLLPAWIQFLLHRQLSDAARGLESMGVFLKGDIPILMCEESADVWSHRHYFDLSARAGAPPDMFSPHGQNWGFPVYDWDRLAGDGYRWWKDRLTHAAGFFHAIRIDHVLGFFRIWGIPTGETTGLLGRFTPSVPLSRADLEELGFDKGRMRWLSLPHVSGEELAAALGGSARHAADLFLDRIESQELYNLKPGIDGEAAIDSLPEPAAVKDFLSSWHRNRTLLPSGVDAFAPSWYHERTKAFQSLLEREKAGLRDLIGRRRRESEMIWEERGRSLLAMLRDTTDMLVCAEDLGDVPDCVPRVLEELGILGLRIVRWSREYKSAAPGSAPPFIPPSRYPRLTVCTPSVHDTSTLRGWWEEDQREREQFYESLGISGDCPSRMSRDMLQRIIRHCLEANSLLCMFQIQDLLDLDDELRAENSRADRINVPGTITDENWTWRMPVPAEELAGRTAIERIMRNMVIKRRQRAMSV